MKYTTKRSRVEEVVIDLEDGCAVRVTPYNIVQFLSHPNFSYTEKSYDVTIDLINGILLNLKCVDERFVNDLSQLFSR